MNLTIKARIESIRRGEVPEGYKRTKAVILPVDWGFNHLSQLAEKSKTKNCEKRYTKILTNSANEGIISQTDYFDKQIANNDNIEGYYIVKNGDFVYNPRISVAAPCGPINCYHGEETGVMSPLYTVFSVDIEKIERDYIEQFFSSTSWHRYMKSVANYGVRSDRMNLSDEDFFLLPVPMPARAEQQKIAEILAGQDRVIALKEKLLAEKQKQKKYLMQQLLTGKKRLPGFSCEWRIVKLKEVLRERDEKNVAQNLEICSVAVQKGVVNQIEHLGRSFAASDTSNYNVVLFGDIVYTKSPTGEFPFGIIKQSQLDKAAVSPLYGVFKPITYALGYILHCYFEIPINTNNYLNPIIQKGAKNTINISNTTFLSNKLLLPMDEKEQTAIAEILSTADKEIELLKKDIEQEKLKKKSLMQLLLTGIVRVKDV